MLMNFTGSGFFYHYLSCIFCSVHAPQIHTSIYSYSPEYLWEWEKRRKPNVCSESWPYGPCILLGWFLTFSAHHKYTHFAGHVIALPHYTHKDILFLQHAYLLHRALLQTKDPIIKAARANLNTQSKMDHGPLYCRLCVRVCVLRLCLPAVGLLSGGLFLSPLIE